MVEEHVIDLRVAGAVDGIDVSFPVGSGDNPITSIAIGRNIMERGLTNVFPDSCDTIEHLRVIGHVTLLDVSWLQDIYIGPYLPNLKSVFLEDVNNIEYWAFGDELLLETIRLPKSIISIGEGAFANIIDDSTYEKLPNIKSFIVEDLCSWCTVKLDHKYSNPCYSMAEGSITDEKTNRTVTSLSVLNINGVGRIADYTFINCQSLTNIDLPSSVTEIGVCAFSECTSLASVTLPRSITRIDSEAFDGCSGISSLLAPDGLELDYLGANAFRGCNPSLFDTTTVPGLTIFEGYVIDASSSLSVLSLINPTIKGFANSLFAGNTNLTEIEIGGGIKEVAQSAFRNCTGLVHLDILEGIQSIGDGAFLYCSSLTTISLPMSLKRIGDGAFARSGLTEVSIPDETEEAGEGCLSFCTSLDTISIGSGLSRISNQMFWCCTSLQSVTIPSNIKEIGEEAFAMIDESYQPIENNLEEVIFSEGLETIGAGAFYQCSHIQTISIPNSATTIMLDAFGHCTALSSVTFGEGLQSIEENVFNMCTNLKTMVFLGNAPEVGSGAFSDVPPDCIVYVRKGTIGWGAVPGKWHDFTTAYITE